MSPGFEVPPRGTPLTASSAATCSGLVIADASKMGAVGGSGTWVDGTNYPLTRLANYLDFLTHEAA